MGSRNPSCLFFIMGSRNPSCFFFILGSSEPSYLLYILTVSFSLRCYHAVSYTHLRAHETPEHLVCSLLLEKKKKKIFFFFFFFNDTATTEIYTRSLVGSVRCV